MPRTLPNIAPLGRRDRRIYSIPLGKDRNGVKRHKPLSDFGIDGGLSLWTILYFAVADLAVLVLAHLPVFGAVLGALMPLVLYTVPAAVIAAALSLFEPEDRPALLWLASQAAHRCAPSSRCLGKRVRPAGQVVIFEPPVAVAGDGSMPELPAGTLRGPGTAGFPGGLLLLEHEPESRVAVARPAAPGDPDDRVLEDVELDAGDELRVVVA